MRRFFLFLLLSPNQVFSQQDDKAFDLSAKYTGDYAVLNNNKYKHFSVYLGNIGMIINFNTENAQLWKGGILSLYIINDHGTQPSKKYTGDLQVFSNIEAPERTKLYELWYEQSFGEKFSIKVGQQNINSEFIYSDYGLNFINSSFGTMPSVACNFTLSMFPCTAFGARVIYNISEQWNIQGAVMDGDPEDEVTNKYGAKWDIKSEEGINILGELHYTLKSEDLQTGKYKIGYWHHTAKFKGVADTTKEYRGDFGIYLLADQMIFSEHSDQKQGLGAFFMFGISSKQQNTVNYGIGGGLCYTGLFKGHDKDVLGLGITNASINPDLVKANDIEKSENTIELVYVAKINDRFTLQPDIQYIINPSGTKNNNALIGLLRFGVVF
jgi:porin